MTEAKDIVKAWDYWPQPPLGKIHHFHYTDAGPTSDTNAPVKLDDMYSLFVQDPDTNSVLYVDYDKDVKWKDTWYLQYRQGYGIAEWRDDNIIEKEDWKTKIFGKRNKIVFRKNYPIWWGDFCEIGKEYTNHPSSDFFASCPPQFINGTQTTKYESKLDSFTLSNGDTYKNVIVIMYQQSWGSKTAGARYWMAKGIGPVAVQWVAPNPNDKTKLIITNRLDAKYTVINGYKKDIQT